MNKKPINASGSFYPAQKKALCFGLALATSLFAGSAGAQLVVADPGGLAQSVASFSQTITQYGLEVKNFAVQASRWTSTVAQYAAVMAHYKQQLISLQNLNSSMVQATNNFTKRNPAEDLKLFCPGPETPLIDIRGIVQQFTANLTANITTQQQKVCENISKLQDQRYNETVDFVQKLANDNNVAMMNIETQRNRVGTAQGALAANENETARYVARTTTDMQIWQAKLSGYDVQLEFLKAQQSALATRALEGDSSNPRLWGEATQAAVLAAATPHRFAPGQTRPQ